MKPKRVRIPGRCGTGVAVCLVLAGTVPSVCAQWTVENLHPAGWRSSTAVSGNGDQLGGYGAAGTYDGHGCIWNGLGGSLTDLHPAGAIESGVHGVWGGQQVGFVYAGDLFSAALWSGTAESWVSLNPEGATSSLAIGVWSGQQVGSAYIGGVSRAGLWNGSAESWVDLHPAGADESTAIGAADGRQVGVVRANGFYRASLWSGAVGTRIDLHPAGSSASRAVGVSCGQQVGWAQFFSSRSHAGLWNGSAATWVDLHPAVATEESEATGVYCGYQVGYARVNGIPHAGLWNGSADSWTDLHGFLPPEFLSSGGGCIWGNGGAMYVAGYGTNTISGRTEAVLWTFVPPRPCAADFNRDGGIDGADVESFYNAWTVFDSSADVNQDGGVDGGDVEFFFVRWESGGCE